MSIYNRHNANPIALQDNQETMKQTVECAVKTGADLSDANL